MSQLFSATGRRYIYGVVIAAIPVLIYLGLLPAESAPVILPLIMAILNVQDDAPAVPGAKD